MLILIDIPEHIYKTVIETGKFFPYRFNTVKAIKNGKTIPKGYGDLIDRKALMDNGYQMEPVEMWYGIKYAPTIIEAESGG